jgi:hypothetical protein
MLRLISSLTAALLVAGPAMAEGFTRIVDREKFVEVIGNRDLTRFAINVQVTETGDIVGRAFGQNVSGDWQWQDGYFCRSLYWGQTELGDNCQRVELSGQTVRFTSDRGTGQFADLKLK